MMFFSPLLFWQVKIWFQNRRTKWKKQENISNAEAAELMKAKGGKDMVAKSPNSSRVIVNDGDGESGGALGALLGKMSPVSNSSSSPTPTTMAAAAFAPHTPQQQQTAATNLVSSLMAMTAAAAAQQQQQQQQQQPVSPPAVAINPSPMVIPTLVKAASPIMNKEESCDTNKDEDVEDPLNVDQNEKEEDVVDDDDDMDEGDKLVIADVQGGVDEQATSDTLNNVESEDKIKTIEEDSNANLSH